MSTVSGLLPTVVNSAVGTLVGLGVGWAAKRVYRRDKERVEALVDTVEEMFGVVINIPDRQKKATAMKIPNPRRFRKAFGAGFGVILTGLLVWASTDGALAQLFQPIIPADLRPLAGVVLGGVAILAGVIVPKNEKKMDAALEGTDDPIVVTPNTPAPATLAAAPKSLSGLATEALSTTEQALWAQITTTQTTPTRVVQLAPMPTTSAL